MFRATLLNVTKETGGSLGEHEFLWPPSAGDRIALPELSGVVGIYMVLRIEHQPVATNRRSIASPPTVNVYVEWVEDWHPPDDQGGE